MRGKWYDFGTIDWTDIAREYPLYIDSYDQSFKV